MTYACQLPYLLQTGSPIIAAAWLGLVVLWKSAGRGRRGGADFCWEGNLVGG